VRRERLAVKLGTGFLRLQTDKKEVSSNMCLFLVIARHRLADWCESFQAGGSTKELKNLASFSTRMGCSLFWQD